ncbi:cupin [Embleya sp. NPDC008237]|uniref:cupin n=1 Tax=Embleya sp. NPDC008237 TaxID=3363978 RepID=UPI0036E2F97C
MRTPRGDHRTDIVDRTGGVDVIDGLDWELIAARYWDRRPVLIRLADAPERHPFRPDDVFASAVAATAANAAGEIPKHVRFAVDRDLKSRPDGWLPRAGDGSLDGYAHRLAERLAGRRYSLTVQAFHAFHPALWRRERAFYDGAFRRFGLPLSSAITTMFHGNYEHTQIGAHKDRFASFMFALQGRKRMRFWPERPWTEAVTSVLDYERYLPASFAVEVHPGEMLYWPSSYHHVGESALDETPATSVNVGLPREFTRSAFEVAEYLTEPTPESMLSEEMETAGLPPLAGPAWAPADPIDGSSVMGELPSALAQAVDFFRSGIDERSLNEWVATLSLRRWTAGGFFPSPPPAPHRALDDEATVTLPVDEPVRWHDTGAARIVAACGHTTRTTLDAHTLTRLLTALRTSRGGTRTGTLLDRLPTAAREDARHLLEDLSRFHALHHS